MFVYGFALKKQFPHLVYFLPPLPPSFLLLHDDTAVASRRNIFSPTQYHNAFQHFVSTHISEPNANVLHSLVRLSSVGNPKKKKKVSEKV